MHGCTASNCNNLYFCLIWSDPNTRCLLPFHLNISSQRGTRSPPSCASKRASRPGPRCRRMRRSEGQWSRWLWFVRPSLARNPARVEGRNHDSWFCFEKSWEPATKCPAPRTKELCGDLWEIQTDLLESYQQKQMIHTDPTG